MDSLSQIKMVTTRNAAKFGLQIAGDLAQQLEANNILPSRWPIKFPLTIKQISKMPEIAGNNKVIKSVKEAANVVWQDIREHAIQVENYISLHPEHFAELNEHNSKNMIWQNLADEIEDISGNLFVTNFNNEDVAKQYVYNVISTYSLKHFMATFGNDYINFINEVREAIRKKTHILPSIRLELICLINTNASIAKKLLEKNLRTKKSKKYNKGPAIIK